MVGGIGGEYWVPASTVNLTCWVATGDDWVFEEVDQGRLLCGLDVEASAGE